MGCPRREFVAGRQIASRMRMVDRTVRKMGVLDRIYMI